MPFTFLAHQAPVLPLVLLRPRWFDGVALCVGSMAPDLSYVVSGTRHGFVSHTGPALLWFCLPTTLLICALTRRAWPPLCAHLPRPARARLTPFTGPAPALPITVISALIGAASHVLLDACTHPRGLGVARWPWLKTVALQLGDRPVPVYSLLQGPGSLVLALLAVLCLRAIARRGAASADPPALATTTASRRCFAVVAAPGLGLALVVSLAMWPIGGLPALILRGATLGFVALVVAALLASRATASVASRDGSPPRP